MKRLLTLSVFGLVLGLALTQIGTAEAKQERGGNDGHVCCENYIEYFSPNGNWVSKRYDIMKHDDCGGDYNIVDIKFCGCDTGSVLDGGKCKSLTGEKMSQKKILRNEFNDDLSKVLKFLDRKSWKKENIKIVTQIISQTRKDIKVIYKQMKTEYLSGGTINLTGYVSKLTAEFTGFKSDLTPYISSGSQLKFTTYIDAKIKAVNNMFTKPNKRR